MDLKRKENASKGSNKIVITFMFTILLLCVLVLIYRLYADGKYILQMYNIFSVLRWVGLGLSVIFAAWGALTWKKTGRFGIALKLCLMSLAIFISGHVMATYYLTGVIFLCIFFVLLAVLYLIYLIYRWEFFLISALIAAGGVALWMMMTAGAGSAPAYFMMSAGLFICVLWLLLCRKIRQNGGNLSIAGIRIIVSSNRAQLMPISAVFVALALLAGSINSAATYYSIIVLICVEFVFAIYYTVKLM